MEKQERRTDSLRGVCGVYLSTGSGWNRGREGQRWLLLDGPRLAVHQAAALIPPGGRSLGRGCLPEPQDSKCSVRFRETVDSVSAKVAHVRGGLSMLRRKVTTHHRSHGGFSAAS